jgi:septal ring factor EnvC (AmiA/AmiB activator)
VLNTVRKKTSDLQILVSALDSKIDETTSQIAVIRKEMRVYKRYAGRRLVALYKLNKAGGMSQILTSADSMYDLFKRNTVFQRVLDHDEKILTSYAKDMSRLNELLEMQKKQKAEKKSLMAELNNQMRIVTTEKNKRSKLLDHISNRKRLELAVIESLRQAQKTLDEKIESYNNQADNQYDVGKGVGRPFARLKGLLNLPVRGRIISFFGPHTNPKYNVVNFKSGIDIETDRGEPVRAVCSGKVLFSDWFKGYGNMLIIDHGDHYYTVYANIEELFKEKGSFVEADEVIATAGDSGSLIGPKLYFEIRYRGEPLDPSKWIKKG